ncbi:baculoviral IAP repeat-containing protein 3-like [Planococcus citri]|uniref:baculoviral IAP repeat-containing protein 3-like n=1 Tax=Planococcus citri TaxID=170843 RepID=UPI0031F8EC0A
MNFQFSGSIPNVHWHSNSNTMSSQSVTEFTILNGRVTVTRAANDTRNDVNVTIVANGRRNDKPRRNCICHRETRWRNRRRQDLHGLQRSINDLKDNVYDATDDLTVARRKLQDIREEIQKIKDEVSKNQGQLWKATNELDKAVGDLQSPSLYNLNDNERNVLRLDLQLAENDIEEARRQIREAEDELGYEIFPSLRRSGIRNEELFDCQTSRSSNSRAVMDVPSEGCNSGLPPVTDNRNKCSICMERTVNAVLYKCGHMCTCFICAVKLQQTSENKSCPVCRREITDVIRTYIS